MVYYTMQPHSVIENPKLAFYPRIPNFHFLISFLAFSSNASCLHSIGFLLFHIFVSSSESFFAYLDFWSLNFVFIHFSHFFACFFFLNFTIFINVALQNIIYIEVSHIPTYLPTIHLSGINKCLNCTYQTLKLELLFVLA